MLHSKCSSTILRYDEHHCIFANATVCNIRVLTSTVLNCTMQLLFFPFNPHCAIGINNRTTMKSRQLRTLQRHWQQQLGQQPQQRPALPLKPLRQLRQHQSKIVLTDLCSTTRNQRRLPSHQAFQLQSTQTTCQPSNSAPRSATWLQVHAYHSRTRLPSRFVSCTRMQNLRAARRIQAHRTTGDFLKLATM